MSAALLLAALPASARAALKASTSIQSSADVTRIVVKLSSTSKLSAKRTPRTVRVKAGKKTYTLSRARGASSATFSLGTWRSAGFTASAAAAVLALQGTHVTVIVRSVGGVTTNLGSKVPKPGSGPGTGGPSVPTSPSSPASPSGPSGPPPLFTPPGRTLTGTEAFSSISAYFLNSEFSDCTGGRWPTCSVENRYEHGASGAFEYHRCTPTSGSDINAYDNFQVTGVEQAPDGSWKIEYTTESGAGFYHWEVSTTGAVNGYYVFKGGPAEPLLNYVWRKPAHLGDCYS
ncbi:MAG TPA: hypothetical protein VES97_01570 [Solirubrobacteraceae bacterium]|nr:hypothetical protein [Solirubrobacteraceae bacterium]